ncbi:MAG: hypothetical protein HOI65_07675 [Opitutae bacterium]|nr:hypothetical protein [Opitutae bacterium]
MILNLIRSLSLLLSGAAITHGGIVHRYSFDGEGTAAMDSVGGKDGVLHGGAKLSGTGILGLDGVNDFVELPMGVLGPYGSLTIEAWTTWTGPSSSNWQNLFHFSENDSKYLYLTPRTGTGSKHIRFGISSGGSEKRLDGLDQLSGDGETLNHIVLTYDGSIGVMALYIDGILNKSAGTTVDLKLIQPVNNWIGKSIYSWAPNYKGQVTEFRIHDTALTTAKVGTSFSFGPDELPGPRIKSFRTEQPVVRSGTNVLLAYECEDPSATLTLEPGGIQLAPGNGSTEVTVNTTTQYTLRAKNEDGARTLALEVVVDDRPEIQSFTVVPETVSDGQSVTLSWDVEFSEIIRIDNGVPAISGGKGSVIIVPTKNTRYTLTALNATGQNTAYVRVSVRGNNEVIINEVHHDPDSPSALTEYLELYNHGLAPIDLSGWYFSSGLTYVFPEGSVLGEGSYLILAQNSDHFETKFGQKPFGVFAGRLSNDGERILLRDAVGNKVDEVDYKSEFPWPVSPSGRGPSMELLNPSLDNNLAGSWRASSALTPGKKNSIYTENAPPQIRHVRHTPTQPRDHEHPVISAKVTDSDLVHSVQLSYQVVEPGQYISAYKAKSLSEIFNKPNDPHSPSPSFEDTANWITIQMTPDTEAGEGIYSTALPPQLNRTIVRYRIKATDREGASVQVPYVDDPSLNFAYYVYNGVPDYVASQRSVHPDGTGRSHPSSILTSLPVYHLITGNNEYTQCIGYSSSDRIPKGNRDSRSAFHWYGSFVYEGVVYDHIKYRLRQANDRYSNIAGKRSMRFRFNRGNLFQHRDINGNKFPYKVRTINTGKMFDNKDVGNFGITETMNSLLWNMTEVPAPHTWWFHYRVVKSQQEQSDQYHGDFQGLYLVFENYDPTFLKTHKLPDGNLYKLKDGVFNGNNLKRHQGSNSVTDDSDFQNIRANLRPERTDDWLNAHVNYDKAYRYHTVNEAIRHFDVQPRDSHSKNRAWFFAPSTANPLGRLWTLPWDSDASWGPNWGAGIDYSHNAAIVGNGGKPDFVRDYRNFIREFRDLLWTDEVIDPMIDRLADKIRDFVPADRDRWKDAPVDAGRQDFGTMEFKVQDMKNFAFNGWSGNGGPSIPTGGRAKHLDNLALDNAIPDMPTISYSGPADVPLDAIFLKSTAFRDPQGVSTFGAIQWRIAEILPVAIPSLIKKGKPKLEWYADWDSGPLNLFSDTIRVPARSLQAGRKYRARVRHQDITGRWSHWSAPIEIIPGQPASLSTLQQGLAISEIYYQPVAATAVEQAAGYTTDDFEFIEFKNVDSKVLDLSDVRLTKGVDYDFIADTQLLPGAIILVVANQEAFEFRYGTNHPIGGVFKGNLADGGENLKLSIGAGISIHEINYDNKPPWPVESGHSLVLAPLRAGVIHASPVSWKSSAAVGGTPGADEFIEVVTEQVRVTEFMAVNRTVLADQSGAFPDWIELQNSSATTIDLSGWALTDDVKIASLWKFPDGTSLPAGARLIVFASGLSPAPTDELHASFKLSGSAGGFLALTNPLGEIVQVFHDYPSQREDFSYGLTDGGLVRFFDQPTPGQLNGNGILGFVKDTKFSHDRGFYDQPFDLKISTDTDGAKIYYTIDGSKPSEQNGMLYANPITIFTTTTLRAIAVKSGHIPTNIDTHTYLFTSGIISQPANPTGFPSTWNGHAADYEMDPEIVMDPRWRNDIQSDLKTIPSLSLVLNRNDMFSAQTGIYPKGESVEKPTSIELIYPNGEKGFQIDGSVQIAGGSSVNRWKSEKLSMRLKFTSSYGPPSLEFPVFGDRAAQEFDTLVLDARLNNVWSYGGGAGGSGQRQRGQYLRDQYAADLQRKLGGDSPHGFNIHLYIDGLYWGIHTLHERPDENFVHHYRGGRPDDYDVMKHRTSTVVHGNNLSYQALVNAANQNLAIDANYEKVKQMMAIEPFIEYMLVNFYLGNTDWGHQNWYASTHRTDPSRNWRFHSWDAEHIMESLNQNAVSRNNNGGPTRIHQQLKLNPEYKTLFSDLVYRHLYNDGILSPENAAAYYRYKASIIERAIIAESARWGDNQRAVPYTKEDWVKERDNLLNNYFPQRRDIVIQQLRSNQAYSSIDPPEFAQRGGEVSAGFNLSFTAANGDIFYTLDGSDPRLKGGGISEIASKYSTGVTLSSPTTLVRARVRLGNEWSAINEATFVIEPAKPTSATLVITEILYEPTSPSAEEKADGFESFDFEFIELQNLEKSKPLNLAGLKFTSGVEFTFPAGLALDPGERILLLSNRRAFESRNGPATSVAGDFQGKLRNNGETLRLIAPDGTVIQSFSYDNSTDWPAGASGGGKSIVLVDPESQPDPSDPSSWKASKDIGGSPGKEESSSSSDGDTDGLPDEWENTYFGNLNQAHDGDFDLDGINNLLEFALGSSPSDPNSRKLPFSSLSSDGYFTLSWSYPEAASNLIFTVEVSEDFKTWVSGKTALVNSITENGITTTTIRDTQPHSESFLRLMRLVISTP